MNIPNRLRQLELLNANRRRSPELARFSELVNAVVENEPDAFDAMTAAKDFARADGRDVDDIRAILVWNAPQGNRPPQPVLDFRRCLLSYCHRHGISEKQFFEVWHRDAGQVAWPRMKTGMPPEKSFLLDLMGGLR